MDVLIAALPEYKWEAFAREHPTVAWSSLAKGNRLEPIVAEALGAAFQLGQAADFTFSTRPAEIAMADIIEEPQQLATGATGCAIEVLCPEGRIDGADDRWARVRRTPGRSDLFSFGLSDVFRPQTLRAEIGSWFDRQGWQTFGPPRPHRNETTAPLFGRELLVRHGDAWRARRICPGDFPTFQPWPVQHAQAQLP